MGGNAAKERRRLKRLKDANINDGNENDNVRGKPNAVAPEDKSTTKKYRPESKFVKKQDGFKKSKNKIPFSKKSNAFESRSKFNTKNSASKGKFAPAKKNKIKKPKHLARKMNAAADPKEMEQLLQERNKFQEKKAERSAKFREKVIEAVGGKAFFDAEIYDRIMEKGGSKMESIIEAVKISDVRNAEKTVISSDRKIQNSQEITSETLFSEEPLAVEGKSEDSSSGQAELSSTLKCIDEKSMEATNVTSMKANNSNPSEDDISHASESSSESDGESNSDSNSDRDSDINSSSEDEDGDQNDNVRTRGRKRRDRKEADAKREELNTKQQEDAKKTAEEAKEVSKKTPRSEDKRRCIGRKALTEFEVGRTYSGIVRYVKPSLGLFIDIGCHSDAFCHISRASDEFIESITDDDYKKGDVLENRVRIVSVDRKKKRITASLQSDKRRADEEKSAKEHDVRVEQKRAKKRRDNFGGNSFSRNSQSSARQVERNGFNSHVSQSQGAKTPMESQDEVPIVIDPDNMTPAELKRARKLQRRQERRKQQELTGIAA